MGWSYSFTTGFKKHRLDPSKNVVKRTTVNQCKSAETTLTTSICSDTSTVENSGSPPEEAEDEQAVHSRHLSSLSEDTLEVLNGYIRLLYRYSLQMQEYTLWKTRTTSGSFLMTSDLVEWIRALHEIVEFLDRPDVTSLWKTQACSWILCENFGCLEVYLSNKFTSNDIFKKYLKSYRIFIRWGDCPKNMCKNLMICDRDYRRFSKACIEVTDKNLNSLSAKFVLGVQTLDCPVREWRQEISLSEILRAEWDVSLNIFGSAVKLDLSLNYQFRTRRPRAMDAYKISCAMPQVDCETPSAIDES